MNETNRFQRLKATFAAAAMTLVTVWAISAYALSAEDGISLAGPLAQRVLPLAFVTN